MRSTPFLDAHPEYRALRSLSGLDYRKVMIGGELVELYLRLGNRVIWSSGVIEAKSLKNVSDSIRVYPKRGEKFTSFISYHRFAWSSGSQTASVRVHGGQPHHHHSGQTIAHVNGGEQRYQDAVRNARILVGRRVKPPRPSGHSPFPQPKAVVKPLITITRIPFLKVNESMDVDGTYFINTVPTTTFFKYYGWSGPNNTPHFGTLKKRQLPVNAFSVALSEVQEDRVVDHRYANTPNFQLGIYPWTENFQIPAGYGHLALARNNAIKKLIEKASLGIDANLAQDFAQLSQITTLIGGTAKKIASSIKDVKKGNFIGAFNTLTAGRSRRNMPMGKPSRHKDLAENWLELQYGWKTLLQDIEGSLKVLSSLDGVPQTVRRVTASGYAEEGIHNTFDCVPSVTGYGAGHEDTRVKTTCKIGLSYRIASPLQSALAQTGFTNPINLAWEVLPFSFVVDWFLPIGPMLESFSAWDGVELLGGYQTQFTKNWVNSAVSYDGPTYGNPTGFTSLHGRFQAEIVYFDRSVVSTFPLMSFPQFKNPLKSVTHAANAIALLTTAFKS